ncbi:hypothetical protein HWV62_27247 [Athelia sp. TMB]|nr:hypothetical protein HWV62_27247 [Athelia sp. TMB]
MVSHGNIWMTGWVTMLALLQISAGIAQTTISGELGYFSLLGTTKNVTTIQSGATAACDLSITIILCYVLHGSRTGIKSTDALLDKLIAYAINRGALTTRKAIRENSAGQNSLPMSSFGPVTQKTQGVHVTKSIVTWTEDGKANELEAEIDMDDTDSSSSRKIVRGGSAV